MEWSNGSGRNLRLAVFLGVLLCVGVLAPSSASAAPHPFLETFGSAEKPSFIEAEGLAVDQSNGTVLAIDGEANTVSRWNPDGTPAEFSTLGTNVIDGAAGGADETPEGGLSFGTAAEVQIAVDNSGGANGGNIYVPQAGARVVDVFGEDGTFLGQLTESSEGSLVEPCGVAVDPSGSLYVGDFGGTIHKYEPAAKPPVNGDNSANFPFSGNCTLAAGAGTTDGFLFAAHFLGSVAKLDATTGAEEFTIDPGPTTTLSVDPFSGNLFTAREGEVVEFDASGASGATVLLPSISFESFAWGIAIDGSTGNVYVSRGGSANIEVFASDRPTTLPTVTALNPDKGPLGGGNSVDITGTDLAKVEKVEFGGTPAELASLVEVSSTEIEIDAPAHAAGTVDVIVTTAGGTSTNTAADDYTYVAPPVVTAINPAKGRAAGGNVIEITGRRLSGATKVEFGTTVVKAPFIENTETTIKLNAPAHKPGKVDVRVTTLGGTSRNFRVDSYIFTGPRCAHGKPGGHR
jgi:sugar lactone lactonase YvrE